MTCPCRQLAGRSWISPPPKIATAGTDMKPTARVLAIILIATPSIRNSPLPARYQKVPVTTSSSRWPAGERLSPVASMARRAPEARTLLAEALTAA